ncbi:hypothetical protein EVG20_g2504 [Dentipellis fragilis]|uniref:Uncharacterized protein n=1 Tax=Dentipellis fragilis TaxID=205917 RepID=A0A4Y9Z7V9_9AGAM|nr:hypothetical protein EVG20_g2504 [Dentipellis fragilis]
MRRASARIAGRARVSAMEARAEVPPGGRSVGDGEEEAPLPPKKEEMADVMVKEEVKEEVYGMGEVCELVKKEEVVVTIKTEEAGPAKRQESYGRVKKQEPEFELPGSQFRATKRTRDIKPKVELAPKKEEPLDSETDDHHNNGGYGEDDGDYLGMNDEEQEDEQPSCKRQKPSAEQASTKKAAAPKKTPKPKKPKQKKLSAAERTAQELGLPPMPESTDESNWRASELSSKREICVSDAQKFYRVNLSKND